MKVFYMMAAILLIGCATTSGISDSSNHKQEPYKFLFSGSRSEASIALKRLLFENGFTIANDDSQAGFLITHPKQLAEDERLSGGFGLALMGSRLQNQVGTVRILFDTSGTNIVCSVSCYLAFDVVQNRNAFKNDTYNSGEEIAAQGHPFPMKIKSAILKMQKFTVLP